MKNVQKSFMKKRIKNKNQGITLIALVITIIVLLILAGVSIETLMGDGRILTKAGKAREETEKGVATATNNLNTMADYITDNVGAKASDVATNPKEYYGAEVTGYSCESTGVAKWRIFYADNNNIYLIADDYITAENAPNGKNGTAITANTDYKLSFNNVYNDYTGSEWILGQTNGVENSKAKSWLIKYFNYSGDNGATYPNKTSTKTTIKAVAYMMDTNIWNKYAGSNAEYAIGGPTLEMFCKSHKDTHPERYVECGDITTNGYKVKWSDGAYATTISGLTKDDFNSIYIKSDQSKAYAMWLASSSADAPNDLMVVACDCNLGINYYGSTLIGLRPLVCLKSNVRIK